MKNRLNKETLLDKYKYHLVFGVFGALCLFALSSFLISDRRKLSAVPVIEEDEIEAFNNQNSDFSVGANDFFHGWKLSDAKQILRNSLSNKPTLPRCMTAEDTSIIPDKYNFRTAKPECAEPVIYNGGNCSSSYAIAAASTLSDRLCFQSGGKVTTRLSAQHILSCDKGNYGCKGGAVNQAFEFAKKEGIADAATVQFDPSLTECPATAATANKEKVIDYCVTNGEEGLKREIFKNGPIVAILPVYRDFLIYKKGIYHIIEGTPRFQGGQIVKVIGWDKDESGTGYWIIENSWGESWGINGLAHVAMGQKQLLIEEFALAVTPFIEGVESVESTEGEDVRVTEEVKPEAVDIDSQTA